MKYPIFVAVLLGGLAPSFAAAQEKSSWQPLWPDGAPGALGKEERDIPSIKVFLPAKEKATGLAVVICPGGGYGGLAMSYEGEDVARWCNTFGAAGIVLKYRLGPKYHHPIEMYDAQRALRFTRAHAQEWGIDPAKVGILGFSAGGHLASTAATHFDAGQSDGDAIDKQSSRPDFAVLVYPVISLVPPYAHMGSRHNLLGPNPDAKVVESLCNDKQVTKETPPTFLMHTSEDTAVPPENSLLFYAALNKHKVPAALHIFAKGPHGIGLGRRGTPTAAWPGLCEAWLRERNLLPAVGKKE